MCTTLRPEGRSQSEIPPVNDQVSYFEVASHLAEIEGDYRDVTDLVARTTALVERLQAKWPGLSNEQAVAYIRLFSSTE